MGNTVDDGQGLRIPPHAIEAEQSVLGSLMIDPSAHDRVSAPMQESDFYRHEHRLIFRAIQTLVAQNKPTDIIAVAESLEENKDLERCGGLAYLGEMANAVPSSANIHHYSNIVREKGLLRKIIQISAELSDMAFSPAGRSAKDLLDQAEGKLFQLSESEKMDSQGFVSLNPLLAAVIDRVSVLYDREDNKDVTGLPTGFVDIDRATAGMHPGDLIVVAARPSMGKTAFAVNIAENVTIHSKLPVAIFSMEMSGEQLAMRIVSSVARVNQSRLKTGQINDEDWPKLTTALGKLYDAKLFIDETPGLNAIDVRSRARKLHFQNNGLGLIIVDYLQLMSPSERRNNENRATEISEITRALKGLAKELRVPVIILSQLNRSLEKREDKRPIMSDLRESGAIEQDADLILFLHREEYYSRDEGDKGRAEVIVGKNRNGPTGSHPLFFRGECTRFETATHSDY